MTGSTHAQRIIALLAQSPALDDDEIAWALSITPRQTVNQVCRRLEQDAVLTRERGPRGKVVNRLADNAPVAHRHVSRSGARSHGTARMPVDAHAGMAVPLAMRHPAKTLIVLPCSASKRSDAAAGDGARIADSLSPELAQELREARERVRDRAAVDEASCAPAWQRYDGSLYANGRDAIHDLLRDGAHVAILSGGYGVVLASESIGMYEAVLKPSWWPRGLLERVLLSYARHHALTAVRAFASATSPYARVLRRIRWGDARVDDAVLLMPETAPGGLVKSPACIGQALRALHDGTLHMEWRSSHGLGLQIIGLADAP